MKKKYVLAAILLLLASLLASCGYSTVEEIAFNGEVRLWAMIYYPYQEATELRDEWPAGSVQLELDLSGLESAGLLKARYGEEEWKSFAFAGATQEEAFRAYVEQGNLQ